MKRDSVINPCVKDNQTNEIKVTKESNNILSKMEQTTYIKAKIITFTIKPLSIAKEANFELQSMNNNTIIIRKNCLVEDEILTLINNINPSKGISQGKEDSEISINTSQSKMNKKNSFLGRKRIYSNRKCTTARFQIINNSSHDSNKNENKEKDKKDVEESKELLIQKVNKEEVMLEIINVLVQGLIEIKNVCVKTLNNVIELNKSLNLPIKFNNE